MITWLIPGLVLAQLNVGSIGLGLGGSIVTETGVNDNSASAGFGFNYYLNLMFTVDRHFSAGLELNGNAAILTGVSTTGLKFEATELNGILAKGKYVFEGSTTKPYLGLMAGIYNIKPGSVEITFFTNPVNVDFEKRTTFGFAPEFGLQVKSFQIAFSAHFPGSYKLTVPDGQGGTVDLENRYRIWLVNLGWNIGFGTRVN